MAWRFVLQPDGKLARFSEVVDNFTHAGLTAGEALVYASRYMSFDEAVEKVRLAVEDEKLKRWREALDIIRNVRGESVLRRTLRAMGMETASA